MKQSAIDHPIAMNVHFDSVNCALGFPEGFRDPSYFAILDRFLEAARKHGFKFSIFVIGKDLENPEVAARVRDLSAEGHEIGNHTWSHPFHFSAMARPQLEMEILKTHEIILKTTGMEPRGFVAPMWSTSREVYRVLIENGYRHDSSVFPSVLYYALVFRLGVQFFKDRTLFRQLLRRKEWLAPLRKPVEPFFVDGDGRVAQGPRDAILVLPMPARSRFSPAFWHTLGFVFGWEYAKKLLAGMLEEKKYFYYLAHPADLVGKEDLDLGDCAYLARMDRGVEEKQARFREMTDLCAASGRKILTMGEIAEGVILEHSRPK